MCQLSDALTIRLSRYFHECRLSGNTLHCHYLQTLFACVDGFSEIGIICFATNHAECNLSSRSILVL